MLKHLLQEPLRWANVGQRDGEHGLFGGIEENITKWFIPCGEGRSWRDCGSEKQVDR